MEMDILLEPAHGERVGDVEQAMGLEHLLLLVQLSIPLYRWGIMAYVLSRFNIAVSDSAVWWHYMWELAFYWSLFISQFFDAKRKVALLSTVIT